MRFLAALTLCVATIDAIQLPNIVYVLVDDWGFGNAGFHRTDNSSEVRTPNIDSIARSGIIFSNHYAFKYCSPSRCALQTGRNPVYVNVINSPIQQWNPKDPVGGMQGAARNFTGVAQKLTKAGYATHAVGYWNETTKASCGTKKHPVPIVDMYTESGPAHGQNGSWACTQATQTGCVFQEEVHTRRVEAIIANASTSEPLFLFWAPHAPHDPYEAPQAYLDRFPDIDVPERRFYAALVSFVDDAVGRVVAALKAKGMWENTLIMVSSDNGGPVGSGYGASNWPLRGGKASNFQGGIRTNAFATGGWIPAALRGTTSDALMALEDWYPTACAIAGVDPTDEDAAAAGLPPVSGFDLTAVLTGVNKTSLRGDLPLGTSDNTDSAGNPIVEGLIRADGWKLLTGKQHSNFWQGPVYPNASGWPSGTLDCGSLAKGDGCLFNVLQDPTEQNDVSAAHPDIVADLVKRINKYQEGVYAPDRGTDDGTACAAAISKGQGFWVPFL